MNTSDVFRVAKGIVGRTRREAFERGRHKFICVALGIAENEGLISKADLLKAQRIIRRRLNGFTTLETWLAHRRCISPMGRIDDAVCDAIQRHRHDWLDLLIAEFQSKGD